MSTLASQILAQVIGFAVWMGAIFWLCERLDRRFHDLHVPFLAAIPSACVTLLTFLLLRFGL